MGKECEICGEKFEKEDLRPLYCRDGTKEHEHVCDRCEEIARSEARPQATVYYNKDDYPFIITEYEDATNGEFDVEYHSTDGWRGYYDAISKNGWSKVHDDAILSYSADAEQLKGFDEEFQDILFDRGIKYARVFTATSNVFCTGYDFFVDSDYINEAIAIRGLLALKYRDSERFNMTALTGKDPVDWDERDHVFYETVKHLEQGLKPEEAVQKALLDNLEVS